MRCGVVILGALIGCAPPPAGVHRLAASGGGPQVLYLNFDGAMLSKATIDYAPGLQSQLATATIPAFAPPPGARFTRQQAIESVVDRVRGWFRRFDVEVVTELPAAAPYTMVMIGGAHDDAGQPSGLAGLAPIDCSDANPNNVAFDFAEDQPPDFGGLIGIAITAAHEAGHAFGLEDTDNARDLMYSVEQPAQTIEDLFASQFSVGAWSGFHSAGVRTCSRADPLDNAAILAANLGTRSDAAESEPPKLSFDFPMLPNVPPSFPVQLTASDDSGVARVEVYKNLELVAVLTAPPYTTTLDAAGGQSLYVTVEAIDGAGNRASLTRRFVAEADSPPLCPDGKCPAGSSCISGLCRFALGSRCATAIECASEVCRPASGSAASVCTQSCDADRPCPEPMTCGVDGLCATPTRDPVPRADGEACAAAAECSSGRCAGVCVPACDGGRTCGDGQECRAVMGGQGCVNVTTITSTGGCEVATRSASGWWALLCALALLRTSRRSRARG